MPTTVTVIDGPRGGGKTFTLHALAHKAKDVGSVLMMDEADVDLFLKDPKNRILSYLGRRYDNVFLTGPWSVRVLSELVLKGVIPIPFNMRHINLNFQEVNVGFAPSV